MLTQDLTEIIFENIEFEQLAAYLKKIDKQYSHCFIISDSTVFALYGEKLKSRLNELKLPIALYLLSEGECAKSLENAMSCWNEMHIHQCDRDTLVIGMGGGVVTDFAGFVAACYMRGVDLIYIPTTLLGMVDAAIGGKNSVNLPSGKNIVGTLHHPKSLFIPIECLKTLPAKEFCSGLAEVIKYGVSYHPALFEFLETHMSEILLGNETAIRNIIQSCFTIKKEIVQKDPTDRGLRSILNYGHTFAHALETATDYRLYRHGEAVSIGMHCAALTSTFLGYTDDSLVKRQKALCQKAQLPTSFPSNISTESMIQLMKGDKKAISGKINLIVPEKIGKVCKVTNVDPTIIKDALMAAG